ncbi:MAG TPA: tyrosine-protein phosphatase, partial [Agromyces sp.]
MKTSMRIPVPGTYNFRDVGGLPARTGVVRGGVLYRSDGLFRLGDDGRAELRDLGVGIVIDLRDDNEARSMPDDLDGLDVEVLRLPVFEGSGASQGMAGISLEALYDRIVTQHASVVVSALREIASAGDRSVIVHCTAGKDRTGVVVALALLAVGVDREAVVDDYAQTESNLAGEWLEGMVAVVSKYGVPDTPELRTLMGGSPREAIEGVLDTIERAHG